MSNAAFVWFEACFKILSCINARFTVNKSVYRTYVLIMTCIVFLMQYVVSIQLLPAAKLGL